MRKNIRVTPVHEKSMIIWNLNSKLLLCRGLNQILMATLSNTSTFCEEIFLRWNAACSEISIFKMTITWIFYNTVVRSSNIKRDFRLNMQQVNISWFLFVWRSSAQFHYSQYSDSFIHLSTGTFGWKCSKVMMFPVHACLTFVFCSFPTQPITNKLRKHLTAHLRFLVALSIFLKGTTNLSMEYNDGCIDRCGIHSLQFVY